MLLQQFSMEYNIIVPAEGEADLGFRYFVHPEGGPLRGRHILPKILMARQNPELHYLEINDEAEILAKLGLED
ncbi:hypothetical protein FHL15_005354 [Xylaria flabelliformis]|uniref:Uncharacterized protein n=1 Tax=Xylaria flabelliformis TaxID=2512241 RepID=A0A553I0E6_9PEZI|nr:hypothetical protein FHL15_005354 [Xylaria flabelliformis]